MKYIGLSVALSGVLISVTVILHWVFTSHVFAARLGDVTIGQALVAGFFLWCISVVLGRGR